MIDVQRREESPMCSNYENVDYENNEYGVKVHMAVFNSKAFTSALGDACMNCNPFYAVSPFLTNCFTGFPDYSGVFN